jgi:transcription antitermination factor NusG
MTVLWYVLQTKPYKETAVWQQLVNQNHQVFFPRLRVNPVNPRARQIRPYFPGYLFVHTDLHLVGSSVFQFMPYTVGLLSFGGETVPVQETIITTLQRRLKEIEAAGGEIFINLRRGDRVVIETGPLAGYDAIFDWRVPGTERVKVLLHILHGQNIPVELNVAHIKRKELN